MKFEIIFAQNIARTSETSIGAFAAKQNNNEIVIVTGRNLL